MSTSARGPARFSKVFGFCSAVFGGFGGLWGVLEGPRRLPEVPGKRGRHEHKRPGARPKHNPAILYLKLALTQDSISHCVSALCSSSAQRCSRWKLIGAHARKKGSSRTGERHKHKRSEVRADFLARCCIPWRGQWAPPGGPSDDPRNSRGPPKVVVYVVVLLSDWLRTVLCVAF